MADEMVDVASKIEFKCGCGAGWSLSGLLASSDLTGALSAWSNQGHTHAHGDAPEVTETRKVVKKDD